MKNSRIIAVHLLNDFSGSPFVFSQALLSLQQAGNEVHLFTATPSGRGFLSDLNVAHHPVFYKWSPNKMLTLFYFLLSQLFIFFKLIIAAEKNDIVYINTMLPFGAAIAARMRGCKVIYHIHEVSVMPMALKKMLLFVIRHTADHCIYVSEFVKKNTSLAIPATVIYNALPFSFMQKAKQHQSKLPERFTVLMLCSLKKYKGVLEFVKCARALPQLQFELVLNASQHEINSFFNDINLPANLILHTSQSDVHPFYARSSVVLNLSLPEKWIETFGMTALEAMCYGKPVIVPTVGGITELVEHGISGYCMDANCIHEIAEKIQKLSQNKELYGKLSEAAYKRAARFSQRSFRNGIIQVTNNVVKETSSQKLKLANV
jgi:glycosyltransferase involved in cell wall biosynthesis